MKHLLSSVMVMAMACASANAWAQEERDPTLDPNSEQFIAPASEAAATGDASTPSAEYSKKKKRKKSEMQADPEEQPAYDIPLIETQNESHAALDINYLTGGIGDEERALIEAAKGDYNLHVSNAGADGSFFGDARVIITRVGPNADPVEVLNVVAGPLLYVKLPQGRYTLEAHRGETIKPFTFTIGRKTHRLSLGWK